MNNEMVIRNAEAFIRNLFANEFSGHDAAHTMRVTRMAVHLAEEEGADRFIVQLAALLHDADDRKLSPGTYEHKDNAVRFLRGEGVEETVIRTIVRIIEEVSFAGEDSVVPQDTEGKCVQDADRLDAIGAIGIARAFTYGGHHNRVMYDPEIPPALHMTKEQYYSHVSTTVNHFHEKLFLLKDMMNTETAKREAVRRDRYMREYLAEFRREWEGIL